MPNAYLNFNGNCRQAFGAYTELLGAKIVSTFTFGASPMAAQVPPEAADLIMHATLQFPDGTLVMGSDVGPWHPWEGGMRACSLSLHATTVEQGKAWFDALANGGTVTMPYSETFWAQGFGMVQDRFGVSWMVNCERPQPA